jgi:DNA repair exonuclease SbcCD ATPase subunit
MTARARLVAIELDAFRGFAMPSRLELDADVVLVRGDNGTGKTSLTDGLLWLFTGAIPRLTERAKGLRKGKDPIVSRYRPNGPARVRLTVALPDGRRVEFEREGRGDRSTLTAWEGEQALDEPEKVLARIFGHDRTPDQLVQAVGSWGILQQHAVLGALDSGTALHERLAQVVGLKQITRFAESANETAKRLGRESKAAEGVLQSLRSRRDTAASRLAAARAETAEPVDAERRLLSLVAACTGDLPEGLSVPRTVSSLEELAALGREVGNLTDDARNLATAVHSVDVARANIAVAVDELERELALLTQRAERAVLRAPAQVQLARAALGLLDDACPVCGQPIDAASVRNHMTELLHVAEAEAAAADDAQRAVVQAQSQLQAARTAEEHRVRAQDCRDDALQRLRERLAATSWIKSELEWPTAESSGALVEELSRFQDRLRDAYVEARRNTSEQIVRFSADVEAADAEIERAETELELLAARKSRAAALDSAAHVAAERIVERALQRLAPSFAEVFDRLSPHPTFTELRATQDIFYGKNQVVPEVYDPDRKVSGNPALIFSEGQLNVVALSYFLGLALNAGDGALPFIVLDDPLQAIDVLGVLGFADLCRRLREQRQLIVTTHDRRFASLLSRKLAPREVGLRTILHEFEGWTEEGPQIRTSDEPLADIVPLLAKRAS